MARLSLNILRKFIPADTFEVLAGMRKPVHMDELSTRHGQGELPFTTWHNGKLQPDPVDFTPSEVMDDAALEDAWAGFEKVPKPVIQSGSQRSFDFGLTPLEQEGLLPKPPTAYKPPPVIIRKGEPVWPAPELTPVPDLSMRGGGGPSRSVQDKILEEANRPIVN